MNPLLTVLPIVCAATQAFAAVKYTQEAFTKAQQAGEKIVLHFHADWCPTCKAQQKALADIENDPAFKGVIFMTVDYDKETELKKTLDVKSQSVFITYYGTVQTARNEKGITSVTSIKEFLQTNLVSLTLKDQLKMMSEASSKKMPPETLKVMKDAIEKQKADQLSKKSLNLFLSNPESTCRTATPINACSFSRITVQVLRICSSSQSLTSGYCPQYLTYRITSSSMKLVNCSLPSIPVVK